MKKKRVHFEEINTLKIYLSNYLANLTSFALLFTLSSLSSPWKYKN